MLWFFLLCKVNRQLKILHRAISAIALTVQRSISFFFAAKSENKKLPGVLPHSYSGSKVPSCDTDEGEYLITLLCKVNRQLKILHRAISAIALTVQRSISFFFAAKSENKKLPGVLPHSYSGSKVPSCDTDEGEYLITLLCKVNRQLKILHRAISAIALTVQRSISFFFAAKSENKKLPGVLPHSYSGSKVPSCDTDEGEYLITLLDGFGSQRSWPKFNADLHRFLSTLFARMNIIHRTALFVSHLLGGAFIIRDAVSISAYNQHRITVIFSS